MEQTVYDPEKHYSGDVVIAMQTELRLMNRVHGRLLRLIMAEEDDLNEQLEEAIFQSTQELAQELEQCRNDVHKCRVGYGNLEKNHAQLEAIHSKCAQQMGSLIASRERVKALEVQLLTIPEKVKVATADLKKERDALADQIKTFEEGQAEAIKEGRRKLASELEEKYAVKQVEWAAKYRDATRLAEASQQQLSGAHETEVAKMREIAEQRELTEIRAKAAEKRVADMAKTAEAHRREISALSKKNAEQAPLIAQLETKIASLEEAAKNNKNAMQNNAERHEKLKKLYKDAIERGRVTSKKLEENESTDLAKENTSLRMVAVDATATTMALRERYKKLARVYQEELEKNEELHERLLECENLLQEVAKAHTADFAAIERAANRGKTAKLQEEKKIKPILLS